MQTHFDDTLLRITDFLEKEVKTTTVVGEAFQLGAFTCIPVIRAGMGFGGGEGDATKQGHGEGIGAGLGIQPIGFLVTKDDMINFIATKPESALAKAFEKVPELLETYLNSRNEERLAEPV